ncbi:hypothetical protein NLJ89_g9960 [Agrocybe chaxingu]|uniref:Uncharacterized protein n=1 Tax=Agrocybe chaxingu TaxID=84603 RepID=A0A9W8JRN6_9AGAR|nr:hypothetical protein NLJ89_g9960 [Agrocybe chaxingu]
MSKQASWKPKPTSKLTPKPAPKLPSQSAPPTQLASYVRSHETLPPPKMRALISLYHQADSWITPDNLLQRIDAAFVPPASEEFEIPYAITLDELQGELNNIKKAPKMVQHDALPRDSSRRADPKKSWSDQRSKRESMVFEALYGVNFDHSGRVMPGLEVLQERSKSLAQQRKEDAETKAERAMDLQDLLDTPPGY